MGTVGSSPRTRGWVDQVMDVDTFLSDVKGNRSRGRNWHLPRALGALPPGLISSPRQLSSMYLSVRLFPVLHPPVQCAHGKWLRVPQPGFVCPTCPCCCCLYSCSRLCPWRATMPAGPHAPPGWPTTHPRPQWWAGMSAATATSQEMCAAGSSSPTRSFFSGLIRTALSMAQRPRMIRSVSTVSPFFSYFLLFPFFP